MCTVGVMVSTYTVLHTALRKLYTAVTHTVCTVVLVLSAAPSLIAASPRAVDYESQRAYKTMMAIVQATVSFVLVRLSHS